MINLKRFFRIVACHLAILAIMLSGLSGCTDFNPGNVLIPLPLEYQGEKIFIAGLSGAEVIIATNDNDEELIPSKVEYVFWGDGFLAAKVHPMVNRNKFPGDTYTQPDTTQWEWYFVDLESGKVDRFASENDFHGKLRKQRINPNSVHWLNLQQAWNASEKALGFEFTSESIKRYLGR